MDWKKIIGASAGVIAVIGGSVFLTKACSEKEPSASVNEILAEMQRQKGQLQEITEDNEALRDSMAMWRDSAAAYKNGLAECQKSKKPQQTTTRSTTKTSDKVKETVYVVYREKEQASQNNSQNNTVIRMGQNAQNNNNMVVQNADKFGGNTEIELGAGSVNNGNIVVNNGGRVEIAGAAQSQAIDSLRTAVDSLKMAGAKGKFAAASSVVLVKKMKVYTRTR